VATSSDSVKDRHQRNSDPLIGRIVAGKYHVLSRVAEGGMGCVYRAEQLPLGRVVALKTLNARRMEPGNQERFLLEAATCARLTHPNVVTLFDYGQVVENGEELLFMAMEFIEGRTLRRVLRDEGPLDPARATRLIRQVARGLRAAHRLGIVHRDLKPMNVMLLPSDDGETAKVLDFGIAKVLDLGTPELTLAGDFVGSPHYSAPEQIRNEAIDGRTDVYALGILLHELLTGRHPFGKLASAEMLVSHLNAPVPRLRELQVDWVPTELEEIMRRCLEKAPEMRFADMDAFLLALDEIDGGSPWATPDPGTPRPRRPSSDDSDRPFSQASRTLDPRAAEDNDVDTRLHTTPSSGSSRRLVPDPAYPVVYSNAVAVTAPSGAALARPRPRSRRWLAPAMVATSVVVGVAVWWALGTSMDPPASAASMAKPAAGDATTPAVGAPSRAAPADVAPRAAGAAVVSAAANPPTVNAADASPPDPPPAPTKKKRPRRSDEIDIFQER
jgi:serine/threonine-protein kinase